MTNIDKEITRAAMSGVTRWLAYGRWWSLTPGQYRVQFNRRRPGKSKVVRV